MYESYQEDAKVVNLPGMYEVQAYNEPRAGKMCGQEDLKGKKRKTTGLLNHPKQHRIRK
jgi:hypothetical protein